MSLQVPDELKPLREGHAHRAYRKAAPRPHLPLPPAREEDPLRRAQLVTEHKAQLRIGFEVPVPLKA